jgi:SAM-dependent methyltransferase
MLQSNTALTAQQSISPPSNYKRITECRAGGGELIDVLSLGDQAMTGYFPKPGEVVPTAPLTLAWSPVSGLLQLRHTCSLPEMYGENYGYRTGLNSSMVKHVERKVYGLMRQVPLSAGDVVLDIGSNDGTLLGFYPNDVRRIGIDPTAEKFRRYYKRGIDIVPDFFSAARFRDVVGRDELGNQKAKIITSLAMFYDLEDPIGFAREVAQCLAPDGVWHIECHYLGAALRDGCYDSIVHEHLEYYSFRALYRIIHAAGLCVKSVGMNGVNGGSITLDVWHTQDDPDVFADWLWREEKIQGFHLKQTYDHFAFRVANHRDSFRNLLERLSEKGKSVVAYGASTKGNVALQYCGIGPDLVSAVAEVNPDKFGCVTPGTNIPIISESEARAMKPDYFLVLPWHFRSGIIEREREFLANGGKMIFPFPAIEVV